MCQNHFVFNLSKQSNLRVIIKIQISNKHHYNKRNLYEKAEQCDQHKSSFSDIIW